MSEIQTLTVEGSEMDLLVARPDGPGPHPGLVIGIHAPAHSGLAADEFTQKVAERYAENGYMAVVPFLFHRHPLDAERQVKIDSLRDDQLLADMNAACDFLGGLNNVDAGWIGVLGHCMGGRVAWLAATHRPDYAAAAIFYGGSIKLGRGEGAAPAIDRAAHMACPVIGFFGNDDENPSPQDVSDISAALEAAGKPHEFHRYDGAGHAFQNFARADAYREQASDDAWEKALAFFASTLKAP